MQGTTFDRRSLLLAGAAAPLLPGRPRRDNPEDLQAFARLAGLRFSDAERTQAAERLDRLRDDYGALRERRIPFELPPCAAFDPFPTAAARRPATGRVAVPIPTDVAMPEREVDLAFLSVLELASLLRQRKVTSRQLTKLALLRLTAFDDRLRCVVNLLGEQALAAADRLDAELADGTDRGPLHGIPYGAKDLFAWPGAPTTFGAAPFADHVWQQTATCLERLQQAGAVLVAKLSLGALAMGDRWHGGRTRNPYDPEQGSSGSSAGSASAVAAGLVPFAIGTETLGSILSPCRRCGVGGLRATFGSISRHGAMPLSWTMDKVGPIARSALDLAIVFDAMRGADGLDPGARDTAFDWRLGRDPARIGDEGLRVGVLAPDGWPRRDDERAFLAWIERNVGRPRPVTLPDAPYRAMLLMLHAEAAAAFDEFTRQGLADQLPGQQDGDWPNQFRSARTIPAVEYLQASRLRRQLVRDMHTALDGIDVLVSPTHGGPLLTASNLTGHPTLAVPIGASPRERDGGRPTLLALTGQLDGEGALLSVAERWQRDTTWHRARPTLTDR